jgi:tetraacyldisaccharide 4'-kinase
MISKDQKLKRAFLWLPAKIYELLVRLRIAAYETDYLKSRRLEAIVISVGNLTVGGTGKTPMVEYIARYLKEEEFQVAILTRGYARKSKGMRVIGLAVGEQTKSGVLAHLECGDEPAMMARSLPEVPIIINSDRYEGGIIAQRELGSNLLILDDGYQHLKLDRDLNILLIDATDPFGEFEMAPFGRLREPLYAIKRADAVIVTRSHRPFDQAQTLAIVKYFCGERVPVMYAYSALTGFRHLATDQVYEAEQFSGWRAVVACGVGNPRAFIDDVQQIGINVVAEHVFPDHYLFSQTELDRIDLSARQSGADMIVMTEKDAVRLEGMKFGETPIYAARLEIQTEDEVRLKSLLLRTAYGKRGPGTGNRN